jgi:hypothetical protein
MTHPELYEQARVSAWHVPGDFRKAADGIVGSISSAKGALGDLAKMARGSWFSSGLCL